MISHIVYPSENEITISLAFIQKTDCHLKFSSCLCSPHMIYYHLLGLLPPTPLSSLAANHPILFFQHLSWITVCGSRHWCLRFAFEETEAQDTCLRQHRSQVLKQEVALQVCGFLEFLMNRSQKSYLLVVPQNLSYPIVQF